METQNKGGCKRFAKIWSYILFPNIYLTEQHSMFSSWASFEYCVLIVKSGVRNVDNCLMSSCYSCKLQSIPSLLISWSIDPSVIVTIIVTARSEEQRDLQIFYIICSWYNPMVSSAHPHGVRCHPDTRINIDIALVVTLIHCAVTWLTGTVDICLHGQTRHQCQCLVWTMPGMCPSEERMQSTSWSWIRSVDSHISCWVRMASYHMTHSL